jgi:hypothetical protein
MSLWTRVRFSDAGGYVKCITCNKTLHFTHIDAGHLRHGVLDFDPINLNPQCITCNKYNSGQRDLYYIWAVKTYGKKTIDDLYQRASMALRGEKKTIEELEVLAIDLTNKVIDEAHIKRDLILPKKYKYLKK